MNQKQFKENFISCVKTGYPLVFIFTLEEERAKRLIYEFSLEINIELCLPRSEYNIFKVGELIDHSKSHSLILIDVVHYSIKDKNTIRALSDIAFKYHEYGNIVVLICPFIEIPLELERFSSVLQLPLPDDELLYQQCIQVEEELSISISEDNRIHFVRMMRGLTLLSAYFAFKKALLEDSYDFNKVLFALIQEKKSILKRSLVLESIDSSVSLLEVGGMDRLKDWLLSRKDAFSEEAKLFGLPCPRGLMLMGVQGCGKSLMAKVVAHYWKLPLIRLDIASIFGCVNPELKLKEALIVVDAMFQAVLWIDEIEKAFENSNSGIGNRLLGSLVTWLQEKQSEVFVVATANYVENLPPELLRKGRFDEIFFIDLPNAMERHEILSIHLKNYGRDPSSFDIEELVKRTERYSGSELEQIVVSGLFYAFYLKKDLDNTDLIRACKESFPLFDMYESEIKSLQEWASKRARSASTNRKKVDLFPA
jgi:AAA+ superfamily predicted ATPase